MFGLCSGFQNIMMTLHKVFFADGVQGGGFTFASDSQMDSSGLTRHSNWIEISWRIDTRETIPGANAIW